MGSGAKGQWFKCKEDAKPHATMPTTTTITERTPKDMPCNFLFCDYLELLWPQRFLVTTITINVLPTKSDLEETKTIMTQKNPDDSSFVLLEFHNLTKWIKTSLHPDGVAF
ncbi:uncharacterized protein [Drosophila suzukii]|uniref:Uncharacterized protein isoform X1 n=1 Tax=Drosophila suzukii TaxID=28584 RepID=A0ABM4TR34_DROSZ